MNKVTLEAIKPLLQAEGDVVLSFYLPTHKFPTSEHIGEDKIRFKNLMRASENAVLSMGGSEELAKQMVDQLETDIYNNDAFWQHTTEGLAVFCAPAGIRYFHLPIEIGEYMIAGDAYDVTPLLALAFRDQPYYLLALATRQPMLYKGDMYSVDPVEIQLPESPEIALNIDELHSNSQTYRSGSQASGAHGQGDSKQAGQEERLKFFRMIDAEIQSSKLVDKNLPLVLAGTDDEVGAYREISHNRAVLDQCVGGNQTATVGVKPHEVHARSWPLVEEMLVQARQHVEVEKIQEMLGTGKASTDIEDIRAAAEAGRVDTFLVGCMSMTRDLVNESEEPAMKIMLSQEYMANGVGMFSQAVAGQGGKVMGILVDEMPGESGAAALYRY